VLCLDTNVVIFFMNKRQPHIVEQLRREFENVEQVALSSIVLFELEFGIAASGRRKKNEAMLAKFLTGVGEVLPFDTDDAREAGDIRAELRRAGTPIGPYDVLIAAQARRRGARLATLNGREFARVPGLLVEDWAA
jgi:tRNA(fMet)-specific endonuclease VapC